jgi:LacI family transcriptional regulator
MPNIREIAAASGYAKSTVSLALRNDPSIPEATRAKIRREAKRLGYTANSTVSRLMAELRRGEDASHRANIALINACAERDVFRNRHTFGQWREGVRSKARALGYGVEELWLNEPGLSLRRARQILHHRSVVGLVIAPEEGSLVADARALWQAYPTVVLGFAPETTKLRFACSDHFAVAELAAERLFAAGHRRPAIVTYRNVEELVGRRFSAGLWAAWQRHLPLEQPIPPLLLSGEDEGAFQEWRAAHRPDAIMTLVPALRTWCGRAGPGLGKAPALVYLDHGPYVADWAGVDQNNLGVGEGAVELLVGLIQGGERGAPRRSSGLLTEGRWVTGETMPRLSRRRG